MNAACKKSLTRLVRCALLAGVAGALGGCASFSEKGGFDTVEAIASPHLGGKALNWQRSADDEEAAARRVAELLAGPLSSDDAVQVALLNHRGLQSAFHELGIAEADLVQAARLPNPGFSFARLRSDGEIEYDRGLHLSLGRLLAVPLATEVASRRFERTKVQLAAQVLALAADTRKAWVQAVAAEESLRYARQVMEAAEASAELARRMAQVGNFNRLQSFREQAFYADAALGVARADARRQAARERLTRLLGLWGAQTGFRLPERLPDLPPEPAERADLERVALAQRLDVQAARLGLQQAAKAVELRRGMRFVDGLEIGLEHNTTGEGATEEGWEIGFEIPLFDWGDARIRRAESVYRQAAQRAAEVAIAARSEVREAYLTVRSAWDIARHHRDEVVPLRRSIAEENLLRYNGMLIGVFELLADARLQIASVQQSIEALRDFWLAQADLDLALIGKPALVDIGTPPPAAAAAAGADPH